MYTTILVLFIYHVDDHVGAFHHLRDGRFVFGLVEVVRLGEEVHAKASNTRERQLLGFNLYSAIGSLH